MPGSGGQDLGENTLGLVGRKGSLTDPPCATALWEVPGGPPRLGSPFHFVDPKFLFMSGFVDPVSCGFDKVGDSFLPVSLVVLPSGAFPMSPGQGSDCPPSGLGWVGAGTGGADTGLTSPAALDPLKKGQSWWGEEERVLLGPSLSGADQVGRSGGLIQTRRLTCEVASLDRAGGSAAPYLPLESAEEALPGPPRGADGTTNTAPEALRLALLFHGECCKTVLCALGPAAPPPRRVPDGHGRAPRARGPARRARAATAGRRGGPARAWPFIPNPEVEVVGGLWEQA